MVTTSLGLTEQNYNHFGLAASTLFQDMLASVRAAFHAACSSALPSGTYQAPFARGYPHHQSVVWNIAGNYCLGRHKAGLAQSRSAESDRTGCYGSTVPVNGTEAVKQPALTMDPPTHEESAAMRQGGLLTKSVRQRVAGVQHHAQ